MATRVPQVCARTGTWCIRMRSSRIVRPMNGVVLQPQFPGGSFEYVVLVHLRHWQPAPFDVDGVTQMSDLPLRPATGVSGS
jgi:hypothetical protein